MDLNSSPTPFSELDSDDPQYDHHQDSCHIFFGPSRDHTGYDYDCHQLYRPQHQTVHESYGYEEDGSVYEIKNRVDGGLKLTLWKKEDESIEVEKSDINPVKWMSSKMRLMQKMKISSKSHENQKLQKSSSSESTDLSSNSLPSYNNNSPIRVCADCNTTKTPLWRSGPKGPKSLCNACGIRQRKARRAMAAANGTAYQPVSAMKIKLQHKEKSVAARNGHKKRFKTTTNSTTDHKNNGFEDFLINLSKNLSLHRVFPEDEKNAAILLMALSSGLVHG